MSNSTLHDPRHQRYGIAYLLPFARPLISFLLVVGSLLGVGLLLGQKPSPQIKYHGLPSETPAKFSSATDSFDFTRREVMIPMRDGVKLRTVLYVPRGAKQAPILLACTPYNAARMPGSNPSAHFGKGTFRYAREAAVDGGYIGVAQDVRGKYSSEGDYAMNRPLGGPQNPTPVDHATHTHAIH